MGSERHRPGQAPSTRLRVWATAAALTTVVGGCHVAVRSEILRPARTERVVHAEGARTRQAAVELTDAGRLRFVEPLECPTEDIIHQRSTVEVAIRPNLATFTVGVLAIAAGGLLLTAGLFANRPGASPYTYAGLASGGVGAPLTVGPWLGQRVELAEGGGDTVLRRSGPNQVCGARPITARAATVAAGGIEIHGAVDRDGVFAISPYQWIDAYRIGSAPPADLTVRLDAAGGARTIAGVLDAAQLAARAGGFLAHVGLDAAIPPLRRVPGIAAGALQVELITVADGAAIRVVLPLHNEGLGDAWAVRGQITAPAIPAIDGRMIYVGTLVHGAAVSRALDIPIAPPAAAALRGQVVELSVELRDAHGTAPSTPVAFRGPLVAASP